LYSNHPTRTTTRIAAGTRRRVFFIPATVRWRQPAVNAPAERSSPDERSSSDCGRRFSGRSGSLGSHVTDRFGVVGSKQSLVDKYRQAHARGLRQPDDRTP
jgi:hypothetical protein